MKNLSLYFLLVILFYGIDVNAKTDSTNVPENIVILAELRHEDTDGNLMHHKYYPPQGKVLVYSNDPSFYFRDESARIIPSERYDNDENKGTALIFKMRKTLFDSLGDFGPIFFTIKLVQKRYNDDLLAYQSVADSLIAVIESNGFTSLGVSAKKMNDPIKLSYPERLTLKTITREINDKLSSIHHTYLIDSTEIKSNDIFDIKYQQLTHGGTYKDSVYVRAIETLNKYTNANDELIPLTIENIDDLLALYLYVKSYLASNSFYNQEAGQLYEQIILMDNDSLFKDRDALQAELNYSRDVYKAYEETYQLLLYHYNRAKELLFYRAEYAVLVKELYLVPELDAPFFVYKAKKERGSFGAFIIPSRLRFRGGVQLNNDITFGISGHYPLSAENNIDLIVGIGISSVVIDDISSTPVVVDINSRFSAFTQAVGITMPLSKSPFQLGLFTGVDFISGNLRDEWEHQGEPWLSVGVTYRIKKRKPLVKESNYYEPFEEAFQLDN